MSERRKRRSASDSQQDSISKEHELEEANERKILYVWQSMDQIFGKVWGDQFGNDPLGKSDPQNRMDQWVEALRYVPWPKVREAMGKLRVHPKPRDYWVPDLPTFLGFVGKQSLVSNEPAAPIPEGTWIDRLCGQLLIRYVWGLSLTPSPNSATRLFEVMQDVKRQFNQIAFPETGEGDDSLTSKEVATHLIKKLTAVDLTEATAEEKKAMREQLWIPKSKSLKRQSSEAHSSF